MHAGRSRLAGGVKSGETGFAVQIRAHAAHRVVCRGTRRDQVFGDVDVVLQAGRVNSRKALLDFRCIQVREIKIHERILGMADLHLVHDGPRHHIARSQFRQRVIFCHEAVHLDIAQIRAVAPQRLREQKAWSLFQVQRGGMKLNELHVADFRSGAEGHSYAISRGYLGVRGVAIELSHTARGQQNRGTCNIFGQSLLIDQRDAGHASAFGVEFGGKLEFPHRDVLERLRFGIESAQDFAPSGIALGMKNAVAAVRALASKHQLGSAAVKLRAPRDKFFDALRPFFHQNFHRFRTAQAIAGDQGVLQMQNDFVFVAQRGRDAALGKLGVGIRDLFLRQHQYPARIRQCDCGTQTGNSGANHHEIGLGWKTFHRGKMVSLPGLARSKGGCF